jgi:hypothetical protein
VPERPAVDVVVPFAGADGDLRALLGRAAALARRDGDTVTVVDNRARGARPAPPPGVRLLAAAEVATSYHARNAGARAGSAPWLVFLDADVAPPRDLLDRYFAPPPGDRTAVLAGGVVDAPATGGASAAVRYAAVKRAMSQDVTLGHGRWAFAQTANCAVLRAAFEAAGGFRDGVRSGGDADLCFRLREAGWELERRERAAVVHRSRATVRALLAQRARHGSGAAWLAREHPGAFPARPLPGATWWAARRAAAGVAALARRDADAAIVGLLDGPALLAFELGRRVPNRPLRRRR